MRTRLILSALIVLAAALPDTVAAQVETIFHSIGMDTPRTFAHASLPGATGIDFSFTGAFSPVYPEEFSHIVVIVFEWGPSVTGPWTASPDNVKSVPGGRTTFFSTGVFHGPEDAAFVQIHFYAGGLMTASGDFTHASVVPEPASAALLSLGLAGLAQLQRRRAGTRVSSAAGL